jgi:hypothetical protein
VNPTPDALVFGRLIEALRPWLPVVVIAGGWAHRLYRLHPAASRLPYPPLMTKDADVALDPADVPDTTEIRTRLVANDFVEDFTGEDVPPITCYRFRKRSSPNFAEFLVPLTGGEYRRDGTRDVTVRVGGISAQKLRFLELLLTAPWTVTLGPAEAGRYVLDVPMDEPTVVRVPNPASYLAQKILIHGYRKPSERAKDTLYLHDTLETFAGALPEIRRTWLEHVKPTLGERPVRRVEAAADQLEAQITDEIREATIQARAVGRDVSADRLIQVCAYGLRKLFEPEF